MAKPTEDLKSKMNSDTAFIVTVPSKEAGEKLLALLHKRIDNYPVICQHPRATTSRGWKGWVIRAPDVLIYPQDWLVRSVISWFLTLPSGAQEIEGLGLIIRRATKKDVGLFLPRTLRIFRKRGSKYSPKKT